MSFDLGEKEYLTDDNLESSLLEKNCLMKKQVFVKRKRKNGR